MSKLINHIKENAYKLISEFDESYKFKMSADEQKTFLRILKYGIGDIIKRHENIVEIKHTKLAVPGNPVSETSIKGEDFYNKYIKNIKKVDDLTLKISRKGTKILLVYEPDRNLYVRIGVEGYIYDYEFSDWDFVVEDKVTKSYAKCVTANRVTAYDRDIYDFASDVMEKYLSKDY